jgi:RNA polymerase sigma-70 factor (ECF subfamily)
MDRQVFNLFAIDGYTHKEIATMLGISEGTSKWHVHEARKKLKESLVKMYKTPSLK